MTTIKPSTILEMAPYVDDLEAAKSFYGGLLHLEEVSFDEKRHIFYRCGDGMLLVFNPAETQTPSESSISVPAHGTSGAGHVCFSATNFEIDEFRARFENAGNEIERDFKWPNGARSLYVCYRASSPPHAILPRNLALAPNSEWERRHIFRAAQWRQ